MDPIYYGFSVLVFAAVILLVEGGYLWWSSVHGREAKRIARRLRVMSGAADGGASQVSILKQRRFSKNETIDSLLHHSSMAFAIDRLLLQAGIGWSVAQYLFYTTVMLVAGLALVQPFDMPLLARAVCVLMLAAVPQLVLLRARKSRMQKSEEQLPEVADFIARALRSGHSFTNVLQMVGTEMPEPLAGEFRTAHQEINYGGSLNEALYNLAERIPLTDLRYLVIAVLIQRESGGNLAEILGNISHIIRERLKLMGQVRVLSAEGRMSAWILGLLPFAAMLMMSIVNPKYVSLLWSDPTGVRMLWYGAGMLLFGAFWLRQITQIRV